MSEFTVIGEHTNEGQISAEVYVMDDELPEYAAIRKAIGMEKAAREEDWEPICVIRGDVQVAWAKDE